MDQLTKEICSRIQQKADDTTKQLKEIQDRIQIAENKIGQLRGRKKATVVKSSSSFPADEKTRAPVQIFPDGRMLPNSHETDPYHSTQFAISSKYNPNTDASLREKVNFYAVKPPSQTRKAHEVIADEGLGHMPATLSSVSGLLLFNTDQNVYSKYATQDPLEAPGSRFRESEIIEEPNKEFGTTTLGQTGTIRVAGLDFRYVPKLDNLPELDLPENLPGLESKFL